LNQIISKGAGRGEWETSLTELENEVTISLDVAGYDSNKSYYIVREHGGSCDRLEATYNTTTGKLEFATDRFSTYAIICTDAQTPGGEDENAYYIDFGTGSWTVGDVTVSAPEGMNGVVPMLDTDTISTEMLENFDPETMDITLTTGDGFVIYLEIDENGNTTLASTRDGVELPPYGENLTFAVVTKPGNMEIVDKTEENACDTVLEEASDVLFEKLGLSAEEVARIENGEDIQVWIEATDISASVSQTDKDLIDSKKGNTTIGMYLDIDLRKQIGSDSPANITDTAGAVTITLKVPSSLINLNSSVTRTYRMVRVHNEVATDIPCTYNAAKRTISFETNQFSTYALVYVDQQNNSGGYYPPYYPSYPVVTPTPVPTVAPTPTATPTPVPTVTPGETTKPGTYVNPPEEAISMVRLGTSKDDIAPVRYLKVGDTVDINFYGVKNWKRDNYEYHWKTSDESVAVVDSVGRLTALKPGVVELTLELKNKAKGHFLNVQTIKFVIPGDYENKILLGTSRNNTFDSIVLNLNERIDINFYGVKNWKKEDYEYYWSSSEPSVVWVDNLGRLVPVNPGKAEVFLVLIEKKNKAPRYVVPMEVTVPKK
ncbi:MAG: hypothetical protein J6K15_05355, partial [Lachnospiraceae bacterium]|nr:hypothetical protein [Lachnospiraceae bacterium]